ncbi:MAG: efflux RND transporter periplasmic adaptor subunit, partial [Phycisphaerae bacterium]
MIGLTGRTARCRPAGPGKPQEQTMAIRRPLRTIRNGVLALLILAGLVGGYLWLRKQHYRLSIYQPQFTTVVRDDLVIPITASGVIQPAARVEIKSKASGEVIRIGQNPDDPDAHGMFLFEGDMVKKGQLLIQLDPADEQRTVERAQAEADLAKANLDKARIEADQAAPARVAAAQAAYDLLRWELQRLQRLAKQRAAEPTELQRAASRLDDAKAKLDLARAQLQQARQDVHRAEAT